MYVKSVMRAVALGCSLLWAGCSENTKPAPTHSGIPAALGRTHPELPSFPVAEAKGRLSGQIWVSGIVPEPEKIPMGSCDPVCRELHEKSPLVSQSLLAGPVDEKTPGKRTLANVLVYVSQGAEKYSYEIPGTPVQLDQKECLFVPRVLGLMAGQTLAIGNSDRTFHSVRSLARKEPNKFFMATPKGEVQNQVLGAAEEPFELNCPVHFWMNGFAGVFEHPFFAVTGMDGRFELKGMLAGEYTLTAWHEKLGTASQYVKPDADGKTPPVEFTFTLLAKGSK